jgi:signal transduction histidine kinase/HAMP domain-containing protein
MKKMSIYSKIFFAFIGLAVIPLIIHFLYLSAGLKLSDTYLRQKASDALDGQTEYMLAQVANSSADKIAMFLNDIKSDADSLALVTPSYTNYIKFYDTRRGILWDEQKGVEYKKEVPLYAEIAFTDISGHEKIRIRHGRPEMLRDISKPENTTYLTEDYYAKAMAMRDNDIYVSRLSGWYRDKNSPQDYEGEFRFVKKVFDDDKQIGLIILSLDQRHIDELIKHIYPTGELAVKTPYMSGSYAFLFDDEGWMIAHPKKEDIRGYDKDGNLMEPFTSLEQEEGTRPFNLLFSGFIHKNYPTAASAVRVGKSGVISVTNVGGVPRIMAYAPIPFAHGEYKRHRIFGGVAIGAEVNMFHKAARVTSDTIRFEFKSYIFRSWVYVVIVLMIVLYVSFKISRGLVKPINILLASTKEMASGKLDIYADVKSNDEIGVLAKSFNTMALSLNEQRQHLQDSLEELERNRHELLWEQVFKTTVFENIDTGVITINHANMVTFMNASARSIFGVHYFEEEVDFDEVAENLPQIRTYVRSGIEQYSVQRFDDYLEVTFAGRKKIFRVAVLPLSIGSYQGKILTIDDVTERMSMRAHLERMERLASLGRLSAGLAHEIRNPLTGVSILLDDLHDMLIGKPEEQDLIRRSLNEIERLDALITELLSFARASSIELRDGDIAPVIDDIVFMVKKQYEKKNIKFEIDISENIPPFPMESAKLKQALLNLIKNGAEAMPEGGTLSIKAYKSISGIKVHIKDTGVGMDEEKIKLIFEPFYTTKGEGTGLGLAITHNIITDHKGVIDVNSTKGKGTEFIITFSLK